jgi:hypothetical protein
MGDRDVPPGVIDVVAEIREDTYRGGNRVNLQLKDFRKSLQ